MSSYECLGEMDFTDADDANIPVNIFLSPDDEEDGWWCLNADNFMPRKGRAAEFAYRFRSQSRQLLVDTVQEHWRPLYENALARLTLATEDADGSASLYYWSRP